MFNLNGFFYDFLTDFRRAVFGWGHFFNFVFKDATGFVAIATNKGAFFGFVDICLAVSVLFVSFDYYWIFSCLNLWWSFVEYSWRRMVQNWLQSGSILRLWFKLMLDDGAYSSLVAFSESAFIHRLAFHKKGLAIRAFFSLAIACLKESLILFILGSKWSLSGTLLSDILFCFSGSWLFSCFDFRRQVDVFSHLYSMCETILIYPSPEEAERAISESK